MVLQRVPVDWNTHIYYLYASTHLAGDRETIFAFPV